LNVLKPKGIRDQKANVLGVWRIEPAQLAAHGSIEGRPQAERRRCRAEHVQRFANEFLDVRFPGRRAGYNDCSVEGSYPEWTASDPDGELNGSGAQVVRIPK
jgi:hypothetical protein